MYINYIFPVRLQNLDHLDQLKCMSIYVTNFSMLECDKYENPDKFLKCLETEEVNFSQFPWSEKLKSKTKLSQGACYFIYQHLVTQVTTFSVYLKM